MKKQNISIAYNITKQGVVADFPIIVYYILKIKTWIVLQ